MIEQPARRCCDEPFSYQQGGAVEVGNVKFKGSLEMVDFEILREVGRTHSKLATLDF